MIERPSRLYVRTREAGADVGVSVGGRVQTVARGRFDLDGNPASAGL